MARDETHTDNLSSWASESTQDVAAGSTRRQLLSAGLGVAAVSAGVALAPSVRAQATGSGNIARSPGMAVAILIFDKITQLDATGPLEVFANAGLNVFTVAPEKSLVTAGSGLRMMPDYDFASAPRADILCVPGGGGVNPLLTDAPTLAYLRRAAGEASYVTSVCTGALLLGAAGLLRGKQATTHWASHHFLEAFAAIPVAQRVVIDGNLITGGGVTAGIDFAFAVLEEVLGNDTAALTMLALEYDPAPPFTGGSPATTRADIVEQYNARMQRGLAVRGEQVALASAALGARS